MGEYPEQAHDKAGTNAGTPARAALAVMVLRQLVTGPTKTIPTIRSRWALRSAVSRAMVPPIDEPERMMRLAP